MNLDHASTKLLFTTTPIWVERQDGNRASGTGFFYSVPVDRKIGSQVVFLATCLHLLEQAKQVRIELATEDAGLPQTQNRIQIHISEDLIHRFSHKESDLALIPISQALTPLKQIGHPIFLRAISPDICPSEEVLGKLRALEEVVFIGYPSGLYDTRNGFPILRRGITATPIWADFNGEPKFLIDAGVFPGSSGSPVLIVSEGSYTGTEGLIVGSRVYFLGFISETARRLEVDSNSVYLGLGVVTKASTIVALAAKATDELIRSEMGPTEDTKGSSITPG